MSGVSVSMSRFFPVGVIFPSRKGFLCTDRFFPMRVHAAPSKFYVMCSQRCVWCVRDQVCSQFCVVFVIKYVCDQVCMCLQKNCVLNRPHTNCYVKYDGCQNGEWGGMGSADDGGGRGAS